MESLLMRVWILLAVAMLSGCAGGTSSDNARRVDHGEQHGQESARPNLDSVPGQFPSPSALTNDGQSIAPVRACVNVSGPNVAASLTVVDCGSREHTYTVVQRVVTPDQCGDADRPFYGTKPAGGEWTACLDLAWDNEYCINIRNPDVTKVLCDDPSAENKYRAVKVIPNSFTTRGCAENGYAHPVRRFTICTERVS